MIPLNNIKINSLIEEDLYKKYKDKVEKVNNSIENIKDFSEILEVESINKLDTVMDNDISVLYYIEAYEEINKVNDYSFCKCPLCKKENTTIYHKSYERNIILHINGYEIIGKISLTVLECKYCKECNKNKQHYHALIPDFIFPYHIYSSNIIMKTLINRFINKLKIEEIIENIKISHQLYYKWLNEFNKYLIVSSTILKTQTIITEVLNEIKSRQAELQYKCFINYYHPYFLFKKTCVPLIIMP